MVKNGFKEKKKLHDRDNTKKKKKSFVLIVVP